MSHGVRWTPVFLVLALALTSCGETKVTGTYVAQSERAVLFVDLIVAPDHHLSGQIKRVAMNDEGDIMHEASSTNGAANSGKITLNLTLNGGPEQVATGTFDSDSIHLNRDFNGTK